MSIDLIVVPQDSARGAARMGAGPDALLSAGLPDRLARHGHGCKIVRIDASGTFHTEIATAFDLQRGVRREVERSRGAGHLPVVLSGNCNTGVVGALAAQDSEDVGLFWFDAHSDAETPETSTSGFLDGMGLAMALGCCFKPMLATVGNFSLRGDRTVHIGAREISPAAGKLLARERVMLVSPQVARSDAAEAALAQPIEALKAAGVRRVHVHVDLDVLDPELVGPANDYALPGGISADQLADLLKVITGSFPLASVSMASYDPALDDLGKVADAGMEAILTLAQAAREPAYGAI